MSIRKKLWFSLPVISLLGLLLTVSVFGAFRGSPISGGGTSFSNSAQLRASLDDETGTLYSVFSQNPVFTTNLTTPQFTLTGSNASPDAVGEVRYDSVIAALANGGLEWHDGSNVRFLIDLDTEPTGAEDEYKVTYDDGAKRFYLSSAGGATAYNDIADPTASGSINMAGYTGTYTSGTEAWGGMIIESTDADNAGDTTLLTLNHYDDFDENSVFLLAVNNSDADADSIFEISGLGTITGDCVPSEAMTGDDGWICGFLGVEGSIYAKGGIVSSAAAPKITLDDSGGADGYWDVNAADADDAVATFGVDDSNGDDQSYIELDGPNERIELKYVTLLEGGTHSLTPVTDSTADFAANFTGANLYGGTFVANADDGDLALPVMAVGMNFCVITLGAIEVVADTNAADGYLMDGTTGVEGANLTNLSAAGDIACFQYYTADDWLITTNGWTAE